MSDEYSQGVMMDGAAILCNGVMITIDEIVSRLNAFATLQHELDAANRHHQDAFKRWRESMEKDLAKYRELAIAAIDVTLLAEECEGDDGEQVFTVNGERFTRLNDLADFFSADGTASILPDAEDSTQPKSGEQCRDDGRCQYAIDHGAEGMGHCPPDKCCMPCTCDMPESICKAHYTTAKL